MWMTKKLCGSLLLCSWLVFLPAAGLCTDTTTTSAQTRVVLSSQQWSRLKEIASEQEMTLANLKTSIGILKQNSTADKQTLLKLNSQLSDCQNRLTNAQLLLNQQSAKLTEANSLLQKNEELLTTLKGQIKALENKISVANRQRDTWAGIAIGLAGYLVYDHSND